MINELSKKHKILCTTRKYREVDQLIKIRKMKLKVIGKHGGSQNLDKLKANIDRMSGLIPIITKFKPDVTISFCSPDAARISFGMGIKHIAFCDAPHADSVMRLTIPLIQKLLIPWVIPKKQFSKFGISIKNIISYRAIDAALIISQKPRKKTVHLKLKTGKNILFRTYESSAAYAKNRIDSIKIIKKLTNIKNSNIIILGRYTNEISNLKKEIGDKVFVLEKSVDSGEILQLTDIFIGSGGTMTAESALRGIPTLSYNAVPNTIEKYLVKRKLVTRIKRIDNLDKTILKILNKKTDEYKKRAVRELKMMDNPIKKLEEVLEVINE
jgi:hypothetical protein